MILGTSLTSISGLLGTPVEKTVLLGTWFAAGCVSTVYLNSKLVERYGPLKVLFAGVLSIVLYMCGIVCFKNYYVCIPLAFFAGFGMGTQDTVCPLLISEVYPTTYSSALSAGQAFYGVGGFSLSLLIGFLLSKFVPFYDAYIILSLVGIVMLAVIPFSEYEQNSEIDHSEKIIPLKTDNPKLLLTIILIICFIYCTVVNSIGLYTTNYLEDIGLNRSQAAYYFTLYNVGCLTGSIAYVWILKKIAEKRVLLMNSIGGALAVGVVAHSQRNIVILFCLLAAGFFLGNLFSVIVAIATRIEYQHISVASSKIAMAGGLGDIVTPIWTALIVKAYGVRTSYGIIVWQILALLLVSALLEVLTKENNYGSSK